MNTASPCLSLAYTTPCLSRVLGPRHGSGHIIRLVDGTIDGWGVNGWRATYRCIDCKRLWTKFTAFSSGDN